ncbi:DUF1310 domain-containing protein [Streptococcus parasanguinis]|uniref:DUF1310 family protein n=1 Tax=Streptococcus parasanguinis TaxID=1318 RepID=UPI001D077E15|nr:DUF1310 family protein [Streptococcus parasanguinis]MCB7322607.1 DUF1310 domain-containing protein [Streptococcus parasanguinis]
MNKRKNRRRLIFSLLVVGILIWIGSKVKDHLEFQQEMVRIVHSKEVEKIVIENLKQKDPFSFTEKGKIQSFKIDDETIEHNPMGGIMFDVTINEDEDIIGSVGLWKTSSDGPIESVGMDASDGLQKLMKE